MQYFYLYHIYDINIIYFINFSYYVVYIFFTLYYKLNVLFVKLLCIDIL